MLLSDAAVGAKNKYISINDTYSKEEIESEMRLGRSLLYATRQPTTAWLYTEELEQTDGQTDGRIHATK